MSEAVSAILASARAAHSRYRAHAGRIDTSGKEVPSSRRLTIAGEAVQEALTARLDAHLRDPEHRDPAWIDDTQAMRGQSHDALVSFYATWLTPRASVKN